MCGPNGFSHIHRPNPEDLNIITIDEHLRSIEKSIQVLQSSVITTARDKTETRVSDLELSVVEQIQLVTDLSSRQPTWASVVKPTEVDKTTVKKTKKKKRKQKTKGDTTSSQLEPEKTSTEKTTKTSDTDDRSRDIDDKPRDQNPSVADGDEMSDSFPKDPDEGFQRPNWEKNREKRHYKNHQRV